MINNKYEVILKTATNVLKLILLSVSLLKPLDLEPF